MKWTKEPPAEPGWYWVSYCGRMEQIVWVERGWLGRITTHALWPSGDSAVIKLDNAKDYSWAGPIPEPEDA